MLYICIGCLRFSNWDSWMPLMPVSMLAATSGVAWNMEKGHPGNYHSANISPGKNITNTLHKHIVTSNMQYVWTGNLGRGDTDSRHKKSYE